MKPKKSTEKHVKLIKKKLDEEYKGTRNTGERKLEEGKDPKKKPDQPNLFGEQDAAYNTIQEEITIVADAISGCHDAIGKKEEQLDDLQKRSQKLHKAAETLAKLRDGALEKKAKEEKGKPSWPAEGKEKK